MLTMPFLPIRWCFYQATAAARQADVVGADVVVVGEALVPEWAPPAGLRALRGVARGPVPQRGAQARSTELFFSSALGLDYPVSESSCTR